MTKIWGVLNVTPDSFSDGGDYFDRDLAVGHAHKLIAAGADVVDVGGESTRPGAGRISLVQEQQRVLPVIKELVAAGITVSVDTLNADTARRARDLGVAFINDVSGGLADPEILKVAASSASPLVLGHWRGPSAQMYARAQYNSVVDEVSAELAARAAAAVDAGVRPEQIVIDPGIGFAKNADHNWQILAGIATIADLGFRVMVGTSRKRFLRDLLGRSSADGAALPPGNSSLDIATAVTSALASTQGVWAVRVHSATETAIALAVTAAWQQGAQALGRESKMFEPGTVA